jgi:hypothetical protein
MHHCHGIRRQPSCIEAHHRDRILAGPGTEFHEFSSIRTAIRGSNHNPLPDLETRSISHASTGRSFQSFLALRGVGDSQ